MTLIQRFYEIAKIQAEAKALRFAVDGHPHDLPWWYYKSKVKHFALGLIDKGAKSDQYFYLLGPAYPEWVFANLAALSLGLRFIALPTDRSGLLPTLLKKHPPSFCFLSHETYVPMAQNILKMNHFKQMIVLNEELKNKLPGSLTFREIFNLGIYQERQHFDAFNTSRRSVTPQHLVSPLRFSSEYELIEQPLYHEEINQKSAELVKRLKLGKKESLLFDQDLAITDYLILSIYWPILAGIQTIFLNPAYAYQENLRYSRPTMVFLRGNQTRQVFAAMESLLPKTPAHYFQRWLTRQRFKTQLGRRIHTCISLEPPDEDIQAIFNLASIRHLTLPWAQD